MQKHDKTTKCEAKTIAEHQGQHENVRGGPEPMLRSNDEPDADWNKQNVQLGRTTERREYFRKGIQVRESQSEKRRNGGDKDITQLWESWKLFLYDLWNIDKFCGKQVRFIYLFIFYNWSVYYQKIHFLIIYTMKYSIVNSIKAV